MSDMKLGDVPISTLNDTDNFIFAEGENIRQYPYGEVKKDILGTESLYDESLSVKEAINKNNASLSDMENNLIDIVQQPTTKMKAVQMYFRSDSTTTPTLQSIISNDTLLTKLKADGVTDIILVPNFIINLATNSITKNFTTTLLTTLVNKLINTYGFSVSFKPHIEDSNQNNVMSTSDITDATIFFPMYKQLLLDTIEVSQSTKVICITNECYKLASQYLTYWTDIINAIKSQNPTIKITDNSCFSSLPTCFISQLDYIGGNFYPSGSNDETSSIIDFKKAWYEVILEINKVCNKYNKQFILTETGILPKSYVGQDPRDFFNMNEAWNVDNQEVQKNYYSAFLEIVMNFDSCVGIWIWNATDTYTFVGNSAEQIVQKYFK